MTHTFQPGHTYSNKATPSDGATPWSKDIQAITTMKINSRYYQIAKGKRKNLTIRNQDHSQSSEPRTPTSPNRGHPNTPEKLDPDLKTYLMMMVEDIKKDFNNSLKEIHENTAKELLVLKEKQPKR